MDSFRENHASRALALAARSLFLLGYLSAGYGIFAMVAYGYLNRFERFRLYFLGLGLLIWFAPGVLFVATGYLLNRRSRRGALIAMIVALFQSLCAAAMLFAFCTLPPISPIPIVMCVVWLAALGQLMLYLQRSLRAIDADVEHRPGFPVEVPRVVLPVDHSADRPF
jgi:hypothetical protein